MIKYFNSPPLHSFYMSRSHKSKLAALLLWRRKLLLLLFYPLLSAVAHEVKSVDLQTRKPKKRLILLFQDNDLNAAVNFGLLDLPQSIL